MQRSISATIGEMTKRIRRHTSLPIAIGFGISDGEQAKAVAEHGDAIVVGSAIVNRIAEFGHSDQLIPQVTRIVSELNQALKGSVKPN